MNHFLITNSDTAKANFLFAHGANAPMDMRRLKAHGVDVLLPAGQKTILYH